VKSDQSVKKTPTAAVPAPSVDEQAVVSRLANCQCSLEEIAAMLHRSVEGVKTQYGDLIARESLVGEAELKQKLHTKAMKGNPSALRLSLDLNERRPRRELQLERENVRLQVAQAQLLVTQATAEKQEKLVDLRCEQEEAKLKKLLKEGR
jgi:hypothetical protein